MQILHSKIYAGLYCNIVDLFSRGEDCYRITLNHMITLPVILMRCTDHSAYRSISLKEE